MTASSAQSTTTEPILLRDDQDGIVTLALNRPERYTTRFRCALMAALQEQLDQIGGDPGVRVVILEGAGKWLLRRPRPGRAALAAAGRARSSRPCSSNAAS